MALATAADLKDHCTAIAAGVKATKHGSTLVGQTVDFEGGPGTSFYFVPAADHPPDSSRPVLDQETSVQIGTTPQVAHTYAYTWAAYGIMNEHQLAFGESTVSGRLAAKSLAHNGTALFSNEELTKIALERCKTARCAVELMGKLAMEGGFYGEGFEVDSGSEALVLADPKEAFVFHIMADPTGRSAIWAAQRVPDDSVAIVPNAMVIREMDLSSDEFYLSSNAKSIARELGWWDGKGLFNFAGTFGLGEYANPYYGARRIWRAYDILAPSLKLDPSKEITPESAGYPFAVKPDALLMAEDVFRVYRDYLEGTPFSLVADEPAAGPFGSPLRVAADKNEAKHTNGAWERPISIYRNDYAVVSECRADGNGVVWAAPHTPHASVFNPVWTNVATTIPESYVVDAELPVDKKSLFWASSAISNWAYGSNFALAIVDIRDAQAHLERYSSVLATTLVSANSEECDVMLKGHGVRAHTAWWDFFFELMGKYNDGYVVTRGPMRKPTASAVGYPDWYLNAVGFEGGVKGASSASYAKLHSRMAAAAEEFAKIDARRKPGPHVEEDKIV